MISDHYRGEKKPKGDLLSKTEESSSCKPNTLFNADIGIKDMDLGTGMIS